MKHFWYLAIVATLVKLPLHDGYGSVVHGGAGMPYTGPGGVAGGGASTGGGPAGAGACGQ